MSFQPLVPMGGLAGWRFLERTAEAQRASFERSLALARDTAYFEANIGRIDSAEALVKDRRLLGVALGAFGLEAEIDKRFFIRKVLEGGSEGPGALARRLSAPGFRQLAEAFGFGNEGGAQTARAGFAERIVEQYRVRQFEAAVGNVDDNMRLALNFRREVKEIAEAATGSGSGWFQLLGSRPLRAVVEKAFGLPKEFGRIDVDRQRDMLRDRTRSLFGDGSVAAFRDPANVERLITRFLARAQIEGVAGAGVTSPALQLLQGMNDGGSAGLLNLLAARR
ncbi:DUF1217 domain-containing protein [soil metagenome]